MSNIRGFSDLESSNNNWRPYNDYNPSSVTPSSEPRCIDSFFPGWTFKSFIVWISAVQIVVYIISVALGSTALSPSSKTLYNLGSSYGPAIQRGQIWRFVTPLFLHGGIWHIAFNVFFQLRLALPLERRYGIPVVSALYFACGIAGVCLSVALQPCITGVGASTAGFGLIGVQMAELALTWHLLGEAKAQAIFNVIMFLFISVMLSSSAGSRIDWRGHLGGFIGGLCIGIYLGRAMEHQPVWLKKFGTTVAITTLSILYLATISVIFIIPMTGANGRC